MIYFLLLFIPFFCNQTTISGRTIDLERYEKIKGVWKLSAVYHEGTKQGYGNIEKGDLENNKDLKYLKGLKIIIGDNYINTCNSYIPEDRKRPFKHCLDSFLKDQDDESTKLIESISTLDTRFIHINDACCDLNEKNYLLKPTDKVRVFIMKYKFCKQKIKCDYGEKFDEYKLCCEYYNKYLYYFINSDEIAICGILLFKRVKAND